MLSRTPQPDEDSIHPLIDGGVLSCTLTLAAPEGVRTAAERSGLQPVFAQPASFSITDGARTLASAEAMGSGASAALSLPLDRDQVLDVLSAIDGSPSRLSVRAEVVYRGSEARRVELTGSWRGVHAAIRRHIGPDGTISLGALRVGFAAMASAGVISSSGVPAEDAAAFETFLRGAAPILVRRTPALDPADPANRFTLRGAGAPDGVLHSVRTVSRTTMRTRSLRTPLHLVLATLAGVDRERFLSVVAQGSAEAAPQPVPRLVVSRGARSAGREAGGDPAPSRMAALPGGLRSMTLALTPDVAAAPRADELIASDMVGRKLVSLAHVGMWAADDAVIADPADEPAPESLPVVSDPSAPLWQDRATPSTYWYAPGFALARPQPNDDPDASPFLFTFSRAA